MSHGSRLSVLCLLCAAGACTIETREASSRRASLRLEQSQVGFIAGLATDLGDDRSAGARLREVASTASGALLAQRTEAGAAKYASNGTRIRSSCGVTPISPSYIVTAAHCADADVMDLEGLVLEMYRPTPALSTSYRTATALGGLFPDYTHGRLAASDGYITERFPCTLAVRCGDPFGPAFNCASDLAAAADVAVLHCEGRPGEKYGQLDVAQADDMTAEVFMPWKHEIYDIPDDPHDDRTLHYAIYSDEFAGNYHYHGANAAGIEQNQLLPLISIPFPDGSAHIKIGTTNDAVQTDLLGCHGASGSGVLQPGPSGWELLGPVIRGNEEGSIFLCNHLPSLGAPNGPGLPGASYGLLDFTLRALEPLLGEIIADSTALPSGATSVMFQPRSRRDNLAASVENRDFAAHLAAPRARDPWGLGSAQVLRLAPGESVGLTGFSVAAGQSYRFGVRAWSGPACTTDMCPELLVTIDGQTVVHHSLDETSNTPISLAGEFMATTSGPARTTFAVLGPDAVDIDAVSLVPGSHTNTLDAWDERLVLAMQDRADLSQAIRFARFQGDGRSGFAARLLPGERLLLPRAALAARHSWRLAFSLSGADALTCGLLDNAGIIVAQAACGNGAATFTDSALLSGATARAAIFVQNDSATAQAALDDITLVGLPLGGGDVDPAPRDGGNTSTDSDAPRPDHLGGSPACVCSLNNGRKPGPAVPLIALLLLALCSRRRRRWSLPPVPHRRTGGSRGLPPALAVRARPCAHRR